MNMASVSIEQLQQIVDLARIELKARRKKEHVVKAKINPRYYLEYKDKSPPGCRSIPDRYINSFPPTRIKYIENLLKQDWDHLFPCEDKTKKYYVYAHFNPKSPIINFPETLSGDMPIPFYIGKGCGNRAFDLKRNQGHGIEIKNTLSLGYTEKDLVRIIKRNLTETEAFALESKLIYFFGTIYQNNRKGVLFNLDVPATPEFIGDIYLEMVKPEKKPKPKVTPTFRQKETLPTQFGQFTRLDLNRMNEVYLKSLQLVDAFKNNNTKVWDSIITEINKEYSKQERGAFCGMALVNSGQMPLNMDMKVECSTPQGEQQ